MKNIVKTRLAILLKITGWSLQELANRSDLSSDTVKNLYYGRIDNPKIETLILPSILTESFKYSSSINLSTVTSPTTDSVLSILGSKNLKK